MGKIRPKGTEIDGLTDVTCRTISDNIEQVSNNIGQVSDSIGKSSINSLGYGGLTCEDR